MARDKPHDWYDIEIEFKGKTGKGRYYVERDVVTVSTWADRNLHKSVVPLPRALRAVYFMSWPKPEKLSGSGHAARQEPH
jgi:hypothetical protein